MNTRNLLDLSLDALDRLSPDRSWGMGELVTASCLLEASAPKAGNVHPEASFEDMNYEDFRRSARVTGDVFRRADLESCGNLVLASVQATRDEVGKNTNLGIILLLSPMVIATRRLELAPASTLRDRWLPSLQATLDSLTLDDCDQVYRAIALAKPGGLGRVEQMDVQQSPPSDLMAAMRVATAWDDVAKQYTTCYADVLKLSDRIDFYRHSKLLGWFDSLSRVHVERLASHGDTLVARKTDNRTLEEVMRLANQALAASDDPRTRRPQWLRLDDFLRADGHRRNPGTTADLLAAAAFVSLLREYNEPASKTFST
jgi:triphosphoribosyl-dephospho-CoA synthase